MILQYVHDLLVGLLNCVLSAFTLVQLANPGALTFYGSSTTSFDFYNDAAPVGSPELALISAAVAQLAHYYKMPSIVAGT